MTGTPQDGRDAAAGTATAGDRRDSEIREALEQDQDQAAGTIDGERRDARDAQDQADTQRQDARHAQDAINIQADTQRQDARDAQDAINIKADSQRQGARDAQDQAETAQDSERQDALALFDARRAGERHEALEQKVADRQQVGELEQANRNLEAFAYSVSHDLRAPLRAMNGYSAALLEEYGPALPAPARVYAEKIQAASGQLAELIAAVLRLARLSRAEVHLEPVDLGAEAAAMAAELQASEPHRHVRFGIQQPAWALADRPLIRTVLQNLLENAWKFTSGQDSASIELEATPDGDSRTRFDIRDNGAGFDPGYAAMLFTPFQRLHPASEFPGTGIGLASVRQIIERHGGQVQGTGATGEGATISFTLTTADPPA